MKHEPKLTECWFSNMKTMDEIDKYIKENFQPAKYTKTSLKK